MLVNLLYSLDETHSEASVTVYWQDIPGAFRDALPRAWPQVCFRDTAFDFMADPIKRISSKVVAWTHALEEHPDTPEICLLDADTLVLRPLDRFFAERPGADVIVSHNPDRENRDRAQINSGVLLLRGGPAAVAFMQAWRGETLRIIADPADFRQANDHSLPYAAADQMALHRLLGYRLQQAGYALVLGGEPVRVETAPSRELNETNSRPLDDRTCVVHYKGGWQQLLLAGRPFSRFRPRLASWEMFALFLDRFGSALNHMNKEAGASFTASDLGVIVPWYFRAPAHFSMPWYAAWRVREAAKRVWLLATGSLKDQ